MPSIRATEATIFLGDLVKFQKRVLQQVPFAATQSYKAHIDLTMFFRWALEYWGNEQRLIFLDILVTTLMFTSEIVLQNDHCVTVRMLLDICLVNTLNFISYVSSEFDCPFYKLLPCIWLTVMVHSRLHANPQGKK